MGLDDAITPPYILRCQKDSYLRELDGLVVVDCLAVSDEDRTRLTGKKATPDASSPQYRVQISDTIMFPEGGGQPSDTGTICADDQLVTVHSVHRDAEDGSTWHFVDQVLSVGTKVSMSVNWIRRFDHMQCHSGQHLITAVAEKILKCPTVAWSLTAFDKPCYLDLEGEKRLEAADLDMLENRVNDLILEDRPIATNMIDCKELEESKDVRKRISMAEFKFPTRLVQIEGIDRNPCCGTHLKSTGDLQMVKILRAEVLKSKSRNGKVINRTYFVAGERLRASFGSLADVAYQLTAKLSCQLNDFVSRTDSLVSSHKILKKEMKSAMREIATLLGSQLVSEAKKSSVKPLVICYHRPDGSSDFLSLLRNAIQKSLSCNDDCVVFLLGGDESIKYVDGAYTLWSSTERDELIASINEKLTDILSAKGNGKKSLFQGKVPQSNLKRKLIGEAQKVVQGAAAS